MPDKNREIKKLEEVGNLFYAFGSVVVALGILFLSIRIAFNLTVYNLIILKIEDINLIKGLLNLSFKFALVGGLIILAGLSSILQGFLTRFKAEDWVDQWIEKRKGYRFYSLFIVSVGLVVFAILFLF